MTAALDDVLGYVFEIMITIYYIYTIYRQMEHIMSDKNTQQGKRLFHDVEQVYFEKLEKLATPLRDCAHDMVVFIDHIKQQTPALKNLKQSYRQLETLPIKELGSSLEKLKKNLDNVSFIKDGMMMDAQNQPDFIGFFEIQNHFNTEMNTLVQHAIKIAQ